jgi:hypothetical protein
MTIRHAGRDRRATCGGSRVFGRGATLSAIGGQSGFVGRVLVWVDHGVSRLISDRRHRLLVRGARRADDRIERIAHRLLGRR